MTHLAIVIPTYGESGNIDELLERIFQTFLKDYVVILVDDRSKDGTVEKAKQWKKQGMPLKILVRKGPRGRGLAGTLGFQTALALGASVIVEMDADLSHAPEDIPRLLSALEQAHVAVGSRFIPGGKIQGRSWWRNGISHLARLWISLWTGLPLQDPTSGFRAYRREVLEQLFATSPPLSLGPEILEEVAYKLYCLGFSFAEVPIHFVERKSGQSHFSFRTAWRVFWFIPLLPFLFGWLKNQELFS